MSVLESNVEDREIVSNEDWKLGTQSQHKQNEKKNYGHDEKH